MTPTRAFQIPGPHSVAFGLGQEARAAPGPAFQGLTGDRALALSLLPSRFAAETPTSVSLGIARGTGRPWTRIALGTARERPPGPSRRLIGELMIAGGDARGHPLTRPGVTRQELALRGAPSPEAGPKQQRESPRQPGGQLCRSRLRLSVGGGGGWGGDCPGGIICHGASDTSRMRLEIQGLVGEKRRRHSLPRC